MREYDEKSGSPVAEMRQTIAVFPKEMSYVGTLAR
jgi:hypothetical protein